jgi:hypothetical protein
MISGMKLFKKLFVLSCLSLFFLLAGLTFTPKTLAAIACDTADCSTNKYCPSSTSSCTTIAAPAIKGEKLSSGQVNLYITTTTPGAAIYFTLDGSTPRTSSRKYTHGFSIGTTTTIKAISVIQGHSSAVSSKPYTVIPPCSNNNHNGTCPSGKSCQYDSGISTWECKNNTPTYTCSNNNHNGTCPSGKSCQYSSDISTWECKNKATLKVATPKLGKDTGTYSKTISVGIQENTSGAKTYYTTDKSEPTTSSKVFTSGNPITISKTTTLKAKAFKSGMTSSDVAKATYTITTGGATKGGIGDKCSTNSDCKSNYCSSHKTCQKDPGTGGGGGGSCTKKTESLTISPSNQTAKVGAQKKYTVTFKNNDTKDCKSDDFSLSKDLGNHLSGSFDKKSFSNVGPGESKSTTLTVKAASGSGVKNISVSVQGGLAKHPKVTNSTATFTIQGDNNGGGGGGGNGGGTKLKVSMGIDALGITPRIKDGNKKPVDGYKSRKVTFKLYNANNNSLAASSEEKVTFDSTDNKFHATINVPDSVATGAYNLYAVGGPYVISRIPGSVTVTKGQANQVDSPNFYLPTGNINNDTQSENKVDVLDYNILSSCWEYSADRSTCNKNPDYIKQSDLNGDGKVDQDDYNYLKKEINIQGDALPN